MKHFCLCGAFPAGQDEPVKRLFEVRCLAQLDALRPECLQALLMLNKRALYCQDANNVRHMNLQVCI